MTDTISGTNQRSASITPKKAIDSENRQSTKLVEGDTAIDAKSTDSSVELSSKLKDEIASVAVSYTHLTLPTILRV